jgi:N4-gp56 family major capsid protein
MATQIYGNGTSTATNGANTIVHFYDRAGIKAANAVSVYSQFADRKSMPTNMGKTFKISKWQHVYDLDQNNVDFAAKGYLGKRSLDSVTTNLANSGGAGTIAEGAGAVNQVTPTKVTFETTLARYGFMIEYSDEVALFSEDNVQVKYREELGYLMNQATEDLVQADMLNSCGININAGGDIDAEYVGAIIRNDDTNADLYKVSFDLIRKAVKALVRNRAQRNTEIVTGSTKIGTKPVNKAFYAIIGPEVKYDLETLTRGSTYEKEYVYIPAYNYAAASNLAEGEVGAMHDVRFIESEGAFVDAGAGSGVGLSYAGALSTTTYADAATALTARGSITVKNTTSSAVAITGVVAGNPYGTSVVAYGTVEVTTTPHATALDAVAGLEVSLEYLDLFPILFPTKGAFATVGLKGIGKMKFYSKSPEDVSLTNPHGTKGFFSANMFYAGLALQPEKLARINVVASK